MELGQRIEGAMAKKRRDPKQRAEELDAALLSLDRSRGPLFREIDQIAAGERGPRSEAPHKACTREFNRMRITDLEAIDIARAFREKPHLAGKLPEVYERLASALEGLRDTEDPQAFTCPLLDGKKCMVHFVAKPIACLAWNPGRDYSKEGWHSFQRRDKLNTALFGERWQLKAIPLQLTRFLEAADRLVAGSCGSTLRKKAMARGEIPRSDEKAAEAAKSPRDREPPRARRGAARFARPGTETKGDRPAATGRRGARKSSARKRSSRDETADFDPAPGRAARRRERIRGREAPRGEIAPARPRKRPPGGAAPGSESRPHGALPPIAESPRAAKPPRSAGKSPRSGELDWRSKPPRSERPVRSGKPHRSGKPLGGGDRPRPDEPLWIETPRRARKPRRGAPRRGGSRS